MAEAPPKQPESPKLEKPSDEEKRIERNNRRWEKAQEWQFKNVEKLQAGTMTYADEVYRELVLTGVKARERGNTAFAEKIDAIVATLPKIELDNFSNKIETLLEHNPSVAKEVHAGLDYRMELWERLAQLHPEEVRSRVESWEEYTSELYGVEVDAPPFIEVSEEECKLSPEETKRLNEILRAGERVLRGESIFGIKRYRELEGVLEILYTFPVADEHEKLIARIRNVLESAPAAEIQNVCTEVEELLDHNGSREVTKPYLSTIFRRRAYWREAGKLTDEQDQELIARWQKISDAVGMLASTDEVRHPS